MKFKTVILALVAIIFFSQCTDENNIELSKKTSESENSIKSDTHLVLGKQVKNPYSLKNMQAAYSSLSKSSSTFRSASVLEPTHLYVRFLPTDINEYNVLESDTTLDLFEYPLDYEISVSGNSYHDPTLPEDQITWQYTKVPMNYQFSNIKYEILDTLYIPIDGIEADESEYRSAQIDNNKWDQLLDESMRLTGNIEATNNTQLRSTSKWRPTATIKGYDDDKVTHVPLNMVKVRARNFLYWNTAYTNADGYVSFPLARYSVSYSIAWESSKWDIRDGWFNQAYYNGSTQKSAWNLNIGGYGSSDKSKRYALIHRALMRTFYGNYLGMMRPITNNIKVCYINSEGDANGDYWGNLDPTGILPDIRIYAKANGNYRRSWEYLGTTIHELGHAAHCTNAGRIHFLSTKKIIYESWARAVQYYVTKQELLELGIYTNHFDYQSVWNIGSVTWQDSYKDYTPLFVDLVDNENQYALYSGGNRPNDNVSGYTMKQLQAIVCLSFSLADLKAYLKVLPKPAGVTNQSIDQLFKTYESL